MRLLCTSHLYPHSGPGNIGTFSFSIFKAHQVAPLSVYIGIYIFRCAVKRTFQTSSFSSGLHVFKRDIKTVLRGHIVGPIPVLKPRYVPGIPGPKEAGHTNDWCIKMEFTARVSECLSERPPVCALWAQLLLQFIPFKKKKLCICFVHELICMWFGHSSFFPSNCRQTGTHARTHIITQLNRQGDKHINKQLVVWVHANDPELRTLHWAMLLNIDLSLFAKINSSFWSGPRSDC